MNKQYFAYVRVSTAKQGDGASLDAQRDAITRYAMKHQLTIAAWFEEKETAAKQGRPVFSEVIKKLHQDAAQGLIMHKIDRSARNLRDWATVSELQDAAIDVHFAAESVDFASRGGRLTADIQAVIAADYIRNLRDETNKGINGRLKQGLYPFKAPIGYLDNGSGKLKTVCPTKGPLVRLLFEEYGRGDHSLLSLVNRAEALGLKSFRGGKVSKTCIEKMLANPFYVGLMHLRRRGETFPGKHEPLISTELFSRVQQVRSGKATKKVTKHNHTYRRSLKCGKCRRTYRAETQKGRVYYRCHTNGCTKGTVREDRLEHELGKILRKVELTACQTRDLRDYVGRWRDHMRKLTCDDTIDLKQGKVRRKREQLLDALLDNLIDKTTYQERNAHLLIQERELSEQKEKQASQQDLSHSLDDLVELLQNLYHTHTLANASEKRQLLEILFANLTITDKKLGFSTQNWMRKAAELATILSGAHCKDTYRKGQQFPVSVTEELCSLLTCPEWQAMRELYHTVHDRQGESRFTKSQFQD
ncbi:recombinase family protein [uncultured Litoreibacter sp.]|uniref:recombinase family protein n=1 Tax=uncultured Litoreibacter sp. TaxID=1392394 RepID=UPI0026379A98|nr:recombinase family protein [uncultured Litoreibacter sp.]